MFDDRDARDKFYLDDLREYASHPWVTTSSRDGLFDTPCGACEHEMDAPQGDDAVPAPPMPPPPSDDLPF